MSIHQIHKIGQKIYASTGNFGIGSEDPNELTMPVTDKEIINDFKALFKLTETSRKD